eukprot:PhF_6_TR25092/c0_g1_i1/m.34461
MDPWDRLVISCRGVFSETDLISLYWDTLKGLLDHYHFTSPVDVAMVELRWKSFQDPNGQTTNNRQSSSSMGGGLKERSTSPSPSTKGEYHIRSKPTATTVVNKKQPQQQQHADPVSLGRRSPPPPARNPSATTTTTVRVAPGASGGGGRGQQEVSAQIRRSRSAGGPREGGVVTTPVGQQHPSLTIRTQLSSSSLLTDDIVVSPRADPSYTYKAPSKTIPVVVGHVGPRVDTNVRGSGAHPSKLHSPREARAPDDLRDLFTAFAQHASSDATSLSTPGNAPVELDCARCVKVFRDSGILKASGNTLTASDIEILFTKAKKKGERKLRYQEFRMVLVPDVARRLMIPISQIVGALSECEGPTVQGTKTARVRLYDDKSSYTGTARSTSTTRRPKA